MRPMQQEVIGLFESHADTLFRHCYLRILDREDGRRIMEHAFTRLWNYLQDGRTLQQPQIVLYRIANGLIAQHRKDKRKTTGYPLQQPATKESPETLSLLAALSAVNDEERDVLVYHFVDRFSVKRTASILGRPVADISQKIVLGSERIGVLLRQ